MWERVSFTSHPSQSKIGCQSWSGTNVGKCLIFVNIWSDPVSAIDYIQPIIFTPKVKMRETAEEKRTMYFTFWKRLLLDESNCMQTFSDFSDWTECSKLTNLLTYLIISMSEMRMRQKQPNLCFTTQWQMPPRPWLLGDASNF